MRSSTLHPFFFNHTATTEIYTLSLHDALPISRHVKHGQGRGRVQVHRRPHDRPDRKSTRLNSSHRCISYAVFCLKKKNFEKASLLAHRLHEGHACLWKREAQSEA